METGNETISPTREKWFDHADDRLNRNKFRIAGENLSESEANRFSCGAFPLLESAFEELTHGLFVEDERPGNMG